MKLHTTNPSTLRSRDHEGGRPLLWFAVAALIVAVLLMTLMFSGGEVAFPLG